jgi:hypothetical protein
MVNNSILMLGTLVNESGHMDEFYKVEPTHFMNPILMKILKY